MALTKVTLIADSTISDVHINTLTTDALTEGNKLFYTTQRVADYLAANNYATTGAGYFYGVSHDTLSNKLTFQKSDSTSVDVDLTQYIDDTNLARLVSGTVDALTGIATFTRDDSSTFTVDFSAFLADANDYVSSGSFNTSTGVLTLTRQGGGTVTVDLDGKYAEASHTHLWSHITDRPTVLSAFTNDLGNYGGFLTSFTETDPIYTASSWYTTTNNAANWNTAYGWGNHAGLYSLIGHTHDYLPIAGKAADSELLDGIDSTGFVRAFGTAAGDIDADWGQSFRTFDPIPTGTPPIASPNLRTINVGNDYNRRTQLAFNYSSDQAWFRRKTEAGWFDWREFIHSGNIGSQSVSYATSAGNADTVDGLHSSSFVQTSNNSSLNGDSRNTRGVTRLYRKDDNSDYSLQTYWTGSYWHLDGYSGDSYHAGVQVAYADSAGAVYGNQNGSFGLNDAKLYLRTNGDNNHYLWNAADDWEELNAYEGTGLRITSVGGSTGILYIYGSSNGGYTYSPYSFRAPIFYDSNDTGYYLNPNGTSRINTVRFDNIGVGQDANGSYRIITSGDIYLNSNGNGWAEGVWKQRRSGGTWYDVVDTASVSSYAAPRAYVTDGYVDFYIYGDQNTYYPVTIHNYNGGYGFQRYSIHRGYSWTAPWNPIGTGVHQGGLTLSFDWAGDIAWGGNDKTIRVIQFSEQYTTMVAGMQLAHCEGVVVWLRGGGAGGAHYRLHGPGGRSQTYTINMSAWTSCAGVTYSPRTGTSEVGSEVYGKYPIRGASEITAPTIYAGTFSDRDNTNYYLNPLCGSEVYSAIFKSSSNYWENDYVQVSPWGFNTCNTYGETVCGGGSNVGVYDMEGYGNYKSTRVNYSTSFSTGATFGVVDSPMFMGMDIYDNNTGENLRYSTSDGDLKIGGVLCQNYYSDCRYKTNITPIESALDKIDAMRGVEFDWNELGLEEAYKEGHEVGVIAQEVQSVYPLAVREVSKERSDKVVTGLVVDYEKLIPLLVQGIKELRQEINDIKQQINGGSI